MREKNPPSLSAFPWPSRREGLCLLALMVGFFATHLGMRSPYLYYTKGHFNLLAGTYGEALGPRGEIVHFDVVNYWPVEQLFSGNYRGDFLGTLGRPFYSFVAALFDPYLHPVYVGWGINLLAWGAAVFFAYGWAFALGGGRMAARLCAFFMAASPGFISMAGQPMGYALGYALQVMFLAAATHGLRPAASRGTPGVPWVASGSASRKGESSGGVVSDPVPAETRAWLGSFGALLFLIVIADLTYEILGLICLVPFLAWAWKPWGWRRTLAFTGCFLAVKLIWDMVVVRGLLAQAQNTALNTKLAEMAASPGALGWDVPFKVATHLLHGFFLSGFYLVPLLACAFAWNSRREGRIRSRIFWPLLGVLLPLGYMGLVGESIGNYRFYKEGRLIAYFYPLAALAAALGLERWRKSAAGEKAIRWRTAGIGMVVAAHFILVQSDVFGIKTLYHLYHRKPGHAWEWSAAAARECPRLSAQECVGEMERVSAGAAMHGFTMSGAGADAVARVTPNTSDKLHGKSIGELQNPLCLREAMEKSE